MKFNSTLFRGLASLMTIFFAIGPIWAQATVRLSSAAYSDLRELVQTDLFKACPPESSFYLALGQSPTPVLAFIQNLGIEQAGDLPLTSVASIESAMQFPQFDETAREELNQHLKRFVPSPKLLKDRQLCMVDLVMTGHSLIAAKRMVRLFYAEHYRVVLNIKTVGFDERLGDSSALLNVDKMISTKKYEELPLMMSLSDFDAVSPHGMYHPKLPPEAGAIPKLRFGTKPPEFKPRPEYMDFREELLEQMAVDTKVKWRNCDGLLSH